MGQTYLPECFDKRYVVSWCFLDFFVSVVLIFLATDYEKLGELRIHLKCSFSKINHIFDLSSTLTYLNAMITLVSGQQLIQTVHSSAIDNQ